MHHQDIFSGDRAVGFQLEAPVSIRVLLRKQGNARTLDSLVQAVGSSFLN